MGLTTKNVKDMPNVSGVGVGKAKVPPTPVSAFFLLHTSPESSSRDFLERQQGTPAPTLQCKQRIGGRDP